MKRVEPSQHGNEVSPRRFLHSMVQLGRHGLPPDSHRRILSRLHSPWRGKTRGSWSFENNRGDQNWKSAAYSWKENKSGLRDPFCICDDNLPRRQNAATQISREKIPLNRTEPSVGPILSIKEFLGAREAAEYHDERKWKFP